jgi:cobalt/nickel transport system permease protein
MVQIEQNWPTGVTAMGRLDPRAKVLMISGFSVAVALFQRLFPVIPAFFVALLLLWLSRMPARVAFRRLLVVNGFIFILWVFLPFTVEGKALFRVGPLVATREGLVYSALITAKGNAILVSVMALVASTSVFDVGRALRRLYVPEKIALLILFTYRYLDVIQLEYQRILRAIRVRGFNPGTNLHTYRTYAYVLGMLFIRSYDRGERIRAAMVCRGFSGKFYDLSALVFKPADWLAMSFMLMAIVGTACLHWAK